MLLWFGNYMDHGHENEDFLGRIFFTQEYLGPKPLFEMENSSFQCKT